jgi:hypothetical protein
LQLFRASEKIDAGAVKPNRRRRVQSRSLEAPSFVQCNKDVLAMTEGPFTLSSRRLEGTSPIGKELPMELTATFTAIMAIMSFGFLAAVILGMI